MSIINRLLFTAILLSGWILFAISNRFFSINKISAMPGDTSNTINNSSAPTVYQNSGFNNDPLQNQIQSELYSSISTGMTYAEVSSILGWEGVLIYENNTDGGAETIETKVYRWNQGNVNLGNIVSDEGINKSNINHDESLILEFQNDILIELNFSERNLYLSE